MLFINSYIYIYIHFLKYEEEFSKVFYMLKNNILIKIIFNTMIILL